MKISYAITVCNEFEEIKRLVEFLLRIKRPKDEIVILYDHKNGSEEIAEWLIKQVLWEKQVSELFQVFQPFCWRSLFVVHRQLL